MTYVRILYDILEGVVCEGLGCLCIYMSKNTIMLQPITLRRNQLGIFVVADFGSACNSDNN